MGFARTFCRTPIGLHAPLVTVETHISSGFPKFNLAGLPETAVRESKDRVRSAIMTSNFTFPRKHITVNFGPADLPKYGSGFDLAIAISVLLATHQIQCHDIDKFEFAGELALSGEIKPIRGILPFALGTAKDERELILAQDSALEAALCRDLTLLPADHLLDVCAHLVNHKTLYKFTERPKPIIKKNPLDLKDVHAQFQAKRALEIAAAGAHNMLMSGPPGTGKTMLASRLPNILPPLTEKEAIEVAAIHSISQANFKHNQDWFTRPFRAPHHSASTVALVGGGSPPKPGEISLAHNGVLFLDELPEYNRQALEAMREPLENACITISRAAHQAEFPANFQLIAAMNPCPCGNLTHPDIDCQCSAHQIIRYQNRLSGPFHDRIDIHIDVPFQRLPIGDLTHQNEDSATVRQRVVHARLFQYERQGVLNSRLDNAGINQFCSLTIEQEKFLKNAINQLHLSARVYHRTLKLARTIADLAHSATIENQHLHEALNYRYKPHKMG